jgi:hypothetical protein
MPDHPAPRAGARPPLWLGTPQAITPGPPRGGPPDDPYNVVRGNGTGPPARASRCTVATVKPSLAPGPGAG